jgi:rhamnogalacturonyl hydrolase YesR
MDQITASLDKVEKWVEKQEYRGYEPFDGLLSYLTPLTFNHKLAKRILIQVVRQSPINLRPVLGIRPATATKGMGYMAWGYLTRLKRGHDGEYARKARFCLDWLMENRSPGHDAYCWGNHFEFVSRSGTLPRDVPTIVWSSLLGQAFLDAYELLEDEKHLEVARSIAGWIMKLPRLATDSGDCLSYVMFAQNSVHNSNMLGAAMLARTGALDQDDEMLAVARSAMTYSVTRQEEDGSWIYGEEPGNGWVDSFHTGYNLDSLKCYIEATGDESWRPQLEKGFEYYVNTFFGEDGLPGYYKDRIWPIDIQCASQAITTLANFADDHPGAEELARRVAGWTIRNMQTGKGFFIYRIFPWGRSRIPMFHWGQATMHKALAMIARAD